MNEIYIIISKLSSKFKEMCYGITQNEVDINDSVQELMLYYMQMNPSTLKRIYEKDGEDGLIRYGAVVLRRSLTSKRSPYYYKYKKYYTHINTFCYNSAATFSDDSCVYDYPNNKNISNIPNTEEEYKWIKLEEIDKILDGLNWYDKKVFELYYSGETLDSLAEKTNISRNSLFTTIDKVRTIIKKELNE